MHATVRAGTRTDIDALVALDRVAHHGNTRAGHITRWCEQDAVLVAEANGEPAGYCVIEYTFFDHGFLTMLMVSESFRGRGIGATLLRAARAACVTPKLFTSTNLSNHAMQRLLHRAGWLSVGMLHDLDSGDPEVFYLHREPEQPLRNR
ncbi:GNAT family N-acetyltransferase [Nocardia sp. BMG111209]|uniref:GNAT family N-acetyltransferase n=1 Tax=Nocardia sp. BMG111209 TaxID=1160137 RepID=UPI000381807E|nr:GNAT family N-acetyltransferase [Nocardia sp. BMG111209]